MDVAVVIAASCILMFEMLDDLGDLHVAEPAVGVNDLDYGKLGK